MALVAWESGRLQLILVWLPKACDFIFKIGSSNIAAGVWYSSWVEISSCCSFWSNARCSARPLYPYLRTAENKFKLQTGPGSNGFLHGFKLSLQHLVIDPSLQDLSLVIDGFSALVAVLGLNQPFNWQVEPCQEAQDALVQRTSR
jgi:hypothetical protein